MKKQGLLAVLFFVMIGTFFSQEKKISNYQYFVVNSKFDFLKERDQYRTSSLTKFLFNEAGFLTYLNDEQLPKELQSTRCNALFVEVKDVSGIFTLKNQIIIKDCFGVELFKSREGSSKLKDYKRGYYESIKEAFESVKELNYSYTPVITKAVEKPKLKKVEAEPHTPKESKMTLYAQATTNGFQMVNLTPEIVFYILKTKAANVFIIKDKNGILYLDKGIWIAEFYENGIRVSQQYEIKF